MEKVQGIDMSLRKIYKEIKIKDLNNKLYRVVNIKEFIDHIENFHSSGTSIHEEKGYFFKVDDAFRERLNKIKKIDCK